MFERRHYTALIEAIDWYRMCDCAKTDLLVELVALFKNDNPNFNPDKFLKGVKDKENSE